MPLRGIVSSKKVVVTETTVTKQQDELDIVAITKLLDSKQKTTAALVQSNATMSSVALAVTRGVYDETNQFWKDISKNSKMIEKQLSEIEKLEADLNDRISKKRLVDEMENNTVVVDDNNVPSQLFATPRSSISSTTLLEVDSSNEKNNDNDNEDMVKEGPSMSY
jgi:hypothetical protein